jgi:23S rRNA U2552 (ribose-2'-O)-methylase RlmE/FtsJ
MAGLVCDIPSVVTFQIAEADECEELDNWTIPELQSQKAEVNKAKEWMDAEYAADPKKLSAVLARFRLDKYKREIERMTNGQHVSNAWIKGVELFNHYGCIPSEGELLYMGIGEFPGSFILAFNYLVSFTRVRATWVGSSLLDINKETRSPLEDRYHLYKNYPRNWLMTPANNGDVTSIANLEDCHRRYPNTVDIMTGDIGMNFDQNYGEEETVQLHANIGQIASVLLMLKKGGTSITKMYSYFEPLTVSLFAVVSRVFDKVEIAKPMFSRPGNTETYLACVGYKGYDFAKPQIDIIMARLANWDQADMSPLVGSSCLNEDFVDSVVSSSGHLARIVVETLNAERDEYHRLKDVPGQPANTSNQSNIFDQKNKDKLEAWVNCNKPLMMSNSKKLRVR